MSVSVSQTSLQTLPHAGRERQPKFSSPANAPLADQTLAAVIPKAIMTARMAIFIPSSSSINHPQSTINNRRSYQSTCQRTPRIFAFESGLPALKKSVTS
jgi:hypothetical protein